MLETEGESNLEYQEPAHSNKQLGVWRPPNPTQTDSQKILHVKSVHL